MKNRQTALERALPIVAAAYGEQFGVRVVLSGSGAYTDGETIVLPMLENMSELKDVLFGYLAHEAAHVRDSDFNTLKKCKTAVEKSCTNIIEDIRIERLIQEVFPGTRFTLDAMWSYVIAQNMSPPSEADQNDATQLLQYLLHRLRSEVLGRTASDHLAIASQQVVEQTFPKGFFVRLDGILGKYMDNLTCSDDCLKVTRAILTALKSAEEEEKQESQSDSEQPQNADSQDDANGDDSGQGQGNSPSSDNEDDSGQSDQSDSQDNSSSSDASRESGFDQSDQSVDTGDSQSTNADQDGQPQDTEAGNSDGSGFHDRVWQETDVPEDIINQLRNDLSDQAQQDQSGQAFQIDTRVGVAVSASQGDASGLQTGILTSSALRSRLVGLLQAQSRTSQRLHCRGRKVDGRRLSRLASGDSRVFIQRNETKKPETSVHVLLDCSGSMHHQQNIANQATISLALAISTIPQCDIAVSMFPGINGPVSPMVKRGQVVRSSIERFAVRSNGSTPLAEGLLYAAKELSGSNKPRKVLIVITDGDPNNGSAVNYINGLIKGHVTTYAIGIGSPAVERYFKNWCVINDVSELQSALFNIASNMLELDI